MDYFDEEIIDSVLGDDFQNYYMSQENNNLLVPSSTSINILSSNTITSSLYNFPTMPPPANKQLNSNNYLNFSTVKPTMNISPDRASSSPIIISFENKNHSESPKTLNPEKAPPNVSQANFTSQGSYNNTNPVNVKQKPQQTNKKKRTRPPSKTYDHIMAERKRREHLSRLFIALSAIVPGLTKTDKTSILSDAIKYLNQLQERVGTLEKQAAKQKMESAVVAYKRTRFVVEDEESSDEKCGSSDEQTMPEIEAKVMNNSILLRVHCEKEKGVVASILAKVESLNMVVANTNVTPFGSSAVEITITAEMEKEFDMTVREVVTAVRATLRSH